MIKNSGICEFANSDAANITSRLSARSDSAAARPELTFRVLIYLAAYALAAGLATLAGWWADVPRLTDWLGSGISMFPNAAVTAACTGAALLLVTFRNRISSLIAGFLGTLVAIVGAATLFQHITGIDLGIDNFLMNVQWGVRAAVVPGRMGPPASAAFVLLGIGIVLSTFGNRARRIVPTLGLLVVAMALLTIIGYAYHANPLFLVARVTGIALQTATIILALGLALLASVPELEPIRTLRRNSAAGVLARRALPVIIGAPIGLGWIFVHARINQWFDRGMGTAILVLALIALFCAVLYWCGEAISVHEDHSRASETRMRSLLQLMPAAVNTCNADGKITYYNRTAAELWGSTPKIGDTDPRFNDQASDRSVFEQALVDHKPYVIEKRYVRPDGSQVWLRDNVAGVTSLDGTLEYLLTVSVDVTERKEIEEQLRQNQALLESELADTKLLQEISAALIEENDVQVLYAKILDAATGIMHSAMASMQAVDEKENGLRLLAYRGFGSDFSDTYKIVHSNARTSCAWARRTCQRVVISDIETSDFLADAPMAIEQYRRDGIFAMQSTPLLSRSGELIGMISTHWEAPHQPSERDFRLLDILARQAADLIERHQSAEQLERTIAERTASLREAIAQMEEFSYTVSHDLRAPLRGMKIYTETLIEDFAKSLPAEAMEYLKRIATNANRLDKMIIDILTFSRLARAEFHLEPVVVDKLVRQIVEQYPGMQSPQAHVTVDALPDVIGHEPSLTQAFSNLLNNAIKFVPENVTPRIRVWGERNKGHVRLWISDNGIGIDPKYQRRLFNMFERVHPNLKYDGTGVGLAIVRKAVERMGGRVGVESDGVNGSNFWIEVRSA